jgi:hypothetical protein
MPAIKPQPIAPVSDEPVTDADWEIILSQPFPMPQWIMLRRLRTHGSLKIVAPAHSRKEQINSYFIRMGLPYRIRKIGPPGRFQNKMVRVIT